MQAEMCIEWYVGNQFNMPVDLPARIVHVYANLYAHMACKGLGKFVDPKYLFSIHLN